MKSLLTFLLASLVLIGTARIATDVYSSISGIRIDEEFGRALRNGCNVFEGKWVLEEDGSRPLYTEDSCPYLTQPVTCRRNGRPDSLYQRWWWQPHQCKLPRSVHFNAILTREA